MTDFWKGAVLALLVLAYVAFPFDFVPGPVDDLILVVISILGSRWKNREN